MNGMSYEKAMGKQIVNNTNYNIINPETRTITVAEKYKLLGIESDEKAKSVLFRCPKIVDKIDLSTMNIYVNYQNANGEKNAHLVDNVIVDGDYIVFEWIMNRRVFMFKGMVTYIVCAKKSDDTGILNEWNTKIAYGFVEEGLEASQEIEERDHDILEQLLLKIENIDNRLDNLTIPTKTSQLENDSGYLTEHQDISGKVDKIEGKGLSTNDYTDEDKEHLHSLDPSSFGKIDAIEVNGVEQEIVDKKVDIIVPTKTSQLENDSNFLTEHQDISGKQDKLIAGDNIEIDGNVISSPISEINIDEKTITKNNSDEIQSVGVIEQNNGAVNKTWIGTKEEYNSISELDANTFYYITDDEVVSKGKVVEVGQYQYSYKGTILPAIPVDILRQVYADDKAGIPQVLHWTLYGTENNLKIVSSDVIMGEYSIDVLIHNKYHCEYKWDNKTTGNVNPNVHSDNSCDLLIDIVLEEDVKVVVHDFPNTIKFSELKIIMDVPASTINSVNFPLWLYCNERATTKSGAAGYRTAKLGSVAYNHDSWLFSNIHFYDGYNLAFVTSGYINGYNNTSIQPIIYEKSTDESMESICIYRLAIATQNQSYYIPQGTRISIFGVIDNVLGGDG